MPYSKYKRGERFVVYYSWLALKIGDFLYKNNITKKRSSYVLCRWLYFCLMKNATTTLQTYSFFFYFAIFLMIFLLIAYLLPLWWRLKKVIILVMSCFAYSFNLYVPSLSNPSLMIADIEDQKAWLSIANDPLHSFIKHEAKICINFNYSNILAMNISIIYKPAKNNR